MALKTLSEASPSAIQAVADLLDEKNPAPVVTSPGDIETESARLSLMKRVGRREVVDDLLAHLRNRVEKP